MGFFKLCAENLKNDKMKILTLLATLLTLLCSATISAHEGHEHGGTKFGPEKKWADTLAIEQTLAMSVAFDAKGRLWRTGVKDHHVQVDYSDDFGKSFSSPVQVNPQIEAVGAEGDSRPKIVIGKRGEVYVSWTMLLDKPYTGDVRFSRSLDGGKTFSLPLTINDNRDVIGHRFDAMALGADGKIYIAWLDKRDPAQAKKNNEIYAGSALYYAVSENNGASFAANVKLADHSCDCCRIALAASSEGAPVVFWRHDFDDNIRDHAVAVLDGKNEIHRVSHDEWKIEACPHHGPALAIAGDNVYHFAWFDNAPKAHGLFYAQSLDKGQTFSAQMHFGDDAHQAGHPDVLSQGREVILVWKEFDGEVSVVRMIRSHDGGVSWSQPSSAALTHDASDHPQLTSHSGKFWLSWNAKQEGYRLIELKDMP
jgi:hypothetical protein